MILEITQIIWLTTPRGTGLAKFLIDNGPEADLQWTVFLENGEVWTFGNTEVRAAENITLGRKRKSGDGKLVWCTPDAELGCSQFNKHCSFCPLDKPYSK